MAQQASNVAAINIPAGVNSGQSYAYTISGDGVIWEYNTTQMKDGSTGKLPINGIKIGSGATASSQIAATWAGASENRSLKRVYFLNNSKKLCDIGNTNNGEWKFGSLSQVEYGCDRLEYAEASNGLLRVGFWDSGNTLWEAVSAADNDAKWNLYQVLNKNLNPSAH